MAAGLRAGRDGVRLHRNLAGPCRPRIRKRWYGSRLGPPVPSGNPGTGWLLRRSTWAASNGRADRCSDATEAAFFRVSGLNPLRKGKPSVAIQTTSLTEVGPGNRRDQVCAIAGLTPRTGALCLTLEKL